MTQYIEVHSTTSSQENADIISTALVETRLAACVQVSSPIRSTYWWRGQIERTDEYFLTMKTTQDKFDEVARVIKESHKYEVPEIVAVPIVDGSEDYLAWISAETREPSAPA